MRLKISLTSLLLVALVFPAYSQTQRPQTASKPVAVSDWDSAGDPVERLYVSDEVIPTSRIKLAQLESLESTTQREDSSDKPRGNIFDHIQIDLLSLEELSQIASYRSSGETIRMTLQQCVYAALEGNQDILIVSYEPLKSEADIFSAKGDFDAVFTASADYTRSTSAASGQIIIFGGVTSIDQELITSSLSLQGRTQLGTQYSISTEMQRDEGTFTGLLREYSGGLTVSLTQPILRGVGLDANMARIRTARKALGISQSQVELTVLNALGEVTKAYWDLVGTIENLVVQEESLSNAQRLVQIDKRRFEIGTAAAIEVLQAKAGVALRLSDVVVAHASIADAEDRLKQLLGMQKDGMFSPDHIVPIDRPNVGEYRFDEKASMARALEHRPEIHTALLEIETAEIERLRARNAQLPQLDITGSYRTGGRAGELSDAYRGVRDSQDSRYTLGFTGSVSLGNRAARGAFTKARLTKRQSEQRLLKAKQDVMLAVRISGRGVTTSQILVESNQQARILQEANVAAEEQRLRLGVTTSHRVLQIQEDLTRARTQEVQATVGFEKALVDLQVAEGVLLENMGVHFENTVVPERNSFWHTLNPTGLWRR